MGGDELPKGEWKADWYTDCMQQVLKVLASAVVDEDSTESADLRLWKLMQNHPDDCMGVVSGAINVCSLLLEYIEQNQVGDRTSLQILQMLADRLPKAE